MKHKPMDFDKLDRLFRYDSETGEIRNRIDRVRAKATEIATSRHSRGYLQVRYPETFLAHRVAWLLYYKEDPIDMQIDHINHIKDDNRIKNLRLVDGLGQNRNHPKQKNNKSGVTGVSRHKDTDKWQVHIQILGKNIYLGLSEDKFEAICIRKSAENEFGFHENHGK